MSDNLTVVRAVYSGLSQRQAAKTHNLSRNTVALLIRYAKEQGWLTLADLDSVDEAMFSSTPGKSVLPQRDEIFRMPDYEYIYGTCQTTRNSEVALGRICSVMLSEQ